MQSITINSTMPKVLGIIPARLESTRLPRKLLADIGGRPLVVHTLERAREAKLVDAVIVATDAQEILEIVHEHGGQAVMTSRRHKCGTDRIAEAARNFTQFAPKIVINIQGDEPFISPKAIDAVARELLNDPKLVMSTVASLFHDAADLTRPNLVKVVLDRSGYALYFSRSVIPFARNAYKQYLKHIGIFGYDADFLQQYVGLKQTPLEIAESLEQLRVLENGYKIKVCVGDFEHISVDVEEDLFKARTFFEQRNNEEKRKKRI